jgi:hypothetical protein
MEVEGASVDLWELDLLKPIAQAEGDDEAQMLGAVLEALLGGKTIKLHFCCLDDHRFVMSMGGGKPFLAKCIAAAKSGEAPLAKAPAVQAGASMLSPRRVFEMHVAPDRIAEMIPKIADVVDEEFTLPDVPPAKACGSVGISVHGTVWQEEIVLPKPMIKWIAGMAMGGPQAAEPQTEESEDEPANE